MSNLNPQELLKALEWRYATKVFDPTKKIPADAWHALESALVLTPTSYGLQPYQFLIVHDPAKRAALLLHSWGQKQLADCSHFVVFTAQHGNERGGRGQAHPAYLRVRGAAAVDALGSLRNMMIGDLVNGPRGKIAHEWATRQAYIALGNLMTCAAVLGVDACPMEGLVPAEYDQNFESGRQRLRDGRCLRTRLSFA